MVDPRSHPSYDEAGTSPPSRTWAGDNMGRSPVDMTTADTMRPTRPGQGGGRIAVLFTCIGRRVSLLRSFARAARKLRLPACFCGTDTTSLSPALQLCDEAFLAAGPEQIAVRASGLPRARLRPGSHRHLPGQAAHVRVPGAARVRHAGDHERAHHPRGRPQAAARLAALPQTLGRVRRP